MWNIKEDMMADELKDALTALKPKSEFAEAGEKEAEDILEKIGWSEDISGLTKIMVSLESEEFTSLCPVTGQPDFGRIIVMYKPHNFIVESKSYKLYLGSFRNKGMFMETIVEKIGEDLVNLLIPLSLKVVGEFRPRGGIIHNISFDYPNNDE